MISKTDYITHLKHPAWLWLRKHDPEFLPTPDDNSQAIIEEGREFERLAEQIFPEAIRLDRNDYVDMQEWADETKALLEQGVVTILASDAHNLEHRPPMLSEGMQHAARIVGDAKAEALVLHTPWQIAQTHFV